MKESRTILHDRKQEITIYFHFLKSSYDNKTISQTSIESSSFVVGGSSRSDFDLLLKIFKSNFILMLYGMVEAVMSNAIEEIHESIHANEDHFDLLSKSMKKIIIKNLKKISDDNIVDNINTLSLDIVKYSFVKRKIFSGDVDAKKINDIGRMYGFNCSTNYEKTHHGECLKNIKDKRNDLAHGVYSFSEIGKDYSIEDLEALMNQTSSYLSEILDNIDDFLNNKKYLSD